MLAAATRKLPLADRMSPRIATQARDILAVLAQEDVRELYISGHCMGHAIAVELARRLLKPDAAVLSMKVRPRLAGLALVAPWVPSTCPLSPSLVRAVGRGAAKNGFFSRA